MQFKNGAARTPLLCYNDTLINAYLSTGKKNDKIAWNAAARLQMHDKGNASDREQGALVPFRLGERHDPLSSAECPRLRRSSSPHRPLPRLQSFREGADRATGSFR